jgi:hypothetical protein
VEEKTDPLHDAPVVRVRVPLSLELNPHDVVGAIIGIEMKKLTVDLRIQPNVCKNEDCRTFGRRAFQGYSPATVEFSAAGVDVHARGAMASREYDIKEEGCLIPGAELIISPFVPLPPGAGAGACLIFATTELPNMIDRGLDGASSGMGKLANKLFNPSAFVVPTDGLPDWLELDASRVYYDLNEGPAVPVAAADGAWTNHTVDLLARGGKHAFILVDLEGTPVSEICSVYPGLNYCRDLCGDRAAPCDLSSAKVCLHFHGLEDCEGGLRLSPGQFKNMLQTARDVRGETEPTDDEIDGYVVEITKNTAPIPAMPQLAALLDISPFAAKTIQSVFAKPLDDAFNDIENIATYSDILHCSDSESRPEACPPGVNGPVFLFLVDSDGDGIRDQDDVCPHSHDPMNVDSDDDEFCDANDLCPWTPSIVNTLQYCHCDVDGDNCPNELLGTPIPGHGAVSSCLPSYQNTYDENPTVSDGGENTDRDLEYPRVTNDCDPDDDGDLFPDTTDNCPSIFNDQADQNNDGHGDLCDPLCPGPDAPCPSPELNDPSLLPMGVMDFDFGARLIPGCLADGGDCWGFFRVGCGTYGAFGACDGGNEIVRWLAPTGAMHAIAASELDLGNVSTFGDITKDGVPDLLISGTSGKAPSLAAVDGATGKGIWQLPASTSLDITSIAVGQSYIAIGAPEYSPKKAGASHGAVQLVSLDGKLLGEPFVGAAGERFGASIAFTSGMMLVGAPGVPVKMSKKPGSGRIYAITPALKKPLLVLDGDEVKASIGASAPVAMVFGGKDTLVVPSGGQLLVMERLKKYAQVGSILKTITASSGSVSLSALADFDGDGVREIAVGVPSQLKHASTIGFMSEDGKLRGSGLAGSNGFGANVIALGDLDGDGASELGVTLPNTKLPGAPFPGAFAVLTKLSKKPSKTNSFSQP